MGRTSPPASCNIQACRYHGTGPHGATGGSPTARTWRDWLAARTHARGGIFWPFFFLTNGAPQPGVSYRPTVLLNTYFAYRLRWFACINPFPASFCPSHARRCRGRQRMVVYVHRMIVMHSPTLIHLLNVPTLGDSDGFLRFISTYQWFKVKTFQRSLI